MSRRRKDEYHTFNKKVGRLVAFIRSEAGETQAELAEVLGYSSGAGVANIEQGNRCLMLESFNIITKHFNVSPNDFMAMINTPARIVVWRKRVRKNGSKVIPSDATA